MMKSLYISCLHPAADSRASKSGVASQRFAGTCAAIVSPYVHSVNMKDMSDSLKPLSATPAPLVRGNVVNTASSTNVCFIQSLLSLVEIKRVSRSDASGSP